MESWFCRFRWVLLLPVLCFSYGSGAQPVLPNITGTAEGGVVLLSWACQYDGVKAIAVKRSSDSVVNFKIIGYVKNTAKGIQAFADGHPQVGTNYYRLNVVFKSGLNWSSNHCRIFVDSEQILARKRVPINDSLQRFIIVHDTLPQPGLTTIPMGSIEPPMPKIKLVFPEQDMEDASFIKSEYLAVNPLNGHLVITLPDDFGKHTYSIKFYSQGVKLVMEIPELKQAKTILDKRNFQRKGKYRFVLKKDGMELESGYININLP